MTSNQQAYIQTMVEEKQTYSLFFLCYLLFLDFLLLFVYFMEKLCVQ